MKIIHLSDLHLGKRVNEFPMLEDQAHILLEILRIVHEETPDAVFIAGDVYDKPVPPAEAVAVFDDFLVSLSRECPHVFVISGNHDSPERIAFGGRLLDPSGIHLSPVYDGHVTPVRLRDDHGEVLVHMLPFVRPATVKAAWPEEAEGIATWTDALRVAVGHMDLDSSARNVLIAHQFVTGAERSESEDVAVGGADNVDASVFADFDYVALGHIHGPQTIDGHIRYCGTPLKYSFSERNHIKSVTVAELGEKGSLTLDTRPLTPRHDLREIRGTYEELSLLRNYQGTATDDYLRVILTDEEDVPDAVSRLRLIYPNLMRLEYDNRRTRAESWTPETETMENKSGMELFEELYEKQNGQPMSETQRAFCRDLFERLKEGQA